MESSFLSFKVLKDVKVEIGVRYPVLRLDSATIDLAGRVRRV